MTFDFDSPVERAGTWSVRWDRYGPDVVPLWVADTDFRAAPAVLQALQERIQHGVFGYTSAPEALREAIVARCAQRYGWRVEPSWIVFLPGVVPGLHLAARRVVPESGHALIPVPVYHHFKRAVELASRPYSELALILDRGRWVFDLDEIPRHSTASTFFLCNPQNPGGTVFRRQELERIAARTGAMTIISDDIHCDLVLDDGLKHVPIASLAPEVSRRTVTLMSANKAFNFPAAGCAWAIAEDARLREAFAAEMRAHVLPSPSVFGYAATLAAYRHGDEWLAAQIAYLRENRDLVLASLDLPIARPEATYLAWIDGLGLKIDNIHELFLRRGVALSPGEQFGRAGFVRLNFGTQRSRLRLALERMRSALAALA